MLRSNLDNIKDDDFAPILFKRNRYLKGSLRIIKVKFFAEEDRNSTGISRAGWRLFHLEADSAFLRFLEPFPEDYLFPLGSSGVIIRGGTRACAKKKDLTTAQAAWLDQLTRPTRHRRPAVGPAAPSSATASV